MGRQLFQDGPFVDPPVTAPAAYSTVTLTPLWPAAAFTPIYANDPKAGKIYCVRAMGLITMSVATASLTITPKYGTGGVALGPSQAQLLPIMVAQPWVLDAELEFSFIGVGGTSKAFLAGKFCCPGTITTPGSGTTVTFGGTLATTLDATINSNIEISTTLGGITGAPLIQTISVYSFSRN